MSNGMFFFKRYSLITWTVYAYELNDAHDENLIAHTVAVNETTSFKKNNPLLIFTFLKPFLQRIFNFLESLLLRLLSSKCVAINGTAS